MSTRQSQGKKLFLDEKIFENIRYGLDTTESSHLHLCVHGAAAFQYLRAGTELGLFEYLNANSGATLTEIEDFMKLPHQSARCLILGLTSLHFIVLEEELYANSFVIESLFIKGEWELFKRLVEFQAYIVYPGQVDFVESLKENRNVGLRRMPGEGETLYEKLSQFPDLQKVFYDYMGAWSEFANPLLFNHVSFDNEKNILDVGGGNAVNAIELAGRYPHAKVMVLDTPEVKQIAEREISKASVSDRVTVLAGDMFEYPFPENLDVVMFIHQLVIWGQDKNRQLMEKAYNALADGGRIVIFSSMSDDDLSGPLFAALDSVYFASVAAGQSMIYSYGDYELLLKSCGFSKVEKIRCKGWSPHGIVIGIK